MPLSKKEYMQKNGLVRMNSLIGFILYLSGTCPPALDTFSCCRKAANFLAAENNVRILDIGSGVGKFCLAASYYKPNAFYYGVEQRKSLVSHAETAKEICILKTFLFLMEILPC